MDVKIKAYKGKSLFTFVANTFDDLQCKLQNKWTELKVLYFEIRVKDEDKYSIVKVVDDVSLKAVIVPGKTLELIIAVKIIVFSKYNTQVSEAFQYIQSLYNAPEFIPLDSKSEVFRKEVKPGMTAKIDADSVVIYNELMRRNKVINKDYTSEYTMREFISPILIGALRLMDDVFLTCEKQIVGSKGRGPLDYSFLYKAIDVVITEAKRDLVKNGIVQNLVQQYASHEFIASVLVASDSVGFKRKREYDKHLKALETIPTYGIVTNSKEWVFTRCIRKNGRILSCLYLSK